MKAQFKFPILGQIKLDPSGVFPIVRKERRFDFLLDANHMLTHVRVTASIEEDDIPKSIGSKENIKKAVLDSAILKDVIKQMHKLEALLSVWNNIRSIDTEVFEIEWIPESDTERHPFNLTKFQATRPEYEPSELEPMPYDLIARSVLAIEKGKGISIISGFFRKGNWDFSNEDYIDAIYDYYLILETLFANGKFKSAEVKKQFGNSMELRSFFEKAFAEPIESWLDNELHSEFLSHSIYSTKDFERYIEHFVMTRGKLHHHSLKNPNAWDPNQPQNYALDAAVLGHLCYQVVFENTFLFLSDPEIILGYEQQVKGLVGTST